MPRIAVALLLCLPLVFAASFVVAAEPSRPARPEELGSLPIEITADRMSADSARDTVTFEGGVQARQGDVTLDCDRLHAEYSKEAGIIEKILAEGNVRLTQEGRVARGARAEFYNMEQRIVLTGDAVLLQGENTLRGESVTIYLREHRSVVTGGSSGRVNAVISPKGGLDPRGRGGR